MATVTHRDRVGSTSGELPALGSVPSFTLTGADLTDFTAESLRGRRVLLNIFPSVDTGVCAVSVREFNRRAAALENTVVLCVSADLPFAASRFCAAEGIENVMTASSFRSSFGEDFGLVLAGLPIAGLLGRAVVVLNEQGEVIYTELVKNISSEPDYDAAIAALS